MRQARDTLRDNKETRLRKPKFTQETLPEIYITDSRNYHETLQETCKRPPVDNPRHQNDTIEITQTHSKRHPRDTPKTLKINITCYTTTPLEIT